MDVARSFSLLIVAPVILLLIFIIAYFLIRKSTKTSSEIMLFGMAFMLLGGIIAADPDSNLAGVEYLLVIIGFITSAVGFIKRSN